MNTDSEKPGSGTAGNSARRRAEENSKNLDNGKSWKKGAIGEEYAGVVIESLCTEYGFKFLHDRNCLLYTSPSPRDRQKSRMPSSA